ncbi:unnamed protein product [Rotaria sordida]|uniref:F-box domain-containing protein n=1 Tax=Rotaria sordida TaxID=392033 RepID=A0A815WJN9_9BILA|nr:unnamed protein product [Rotaria sordida]
MKFEDLANELFLDIFELLDGVDLLHAFHNLNYRVNRLLLIHFRFYHLDFRSLSKNRFDIITENYLRLISDKILSIHLSNDDDTPDLPYLFVSRGYTLNKFINLQSLSLYYIDCFDILNEIIVQCNHLTYLTDLKLIKCYFNSEENDFHCLINNIWNLPKLRKCLLDQINSRKIRLNELSMMSSSIEELSLERMICSLKDLSNLFEHSPCLGRLTVNNISCSKFEQLEIVIRSLTSLKTFFDSSIDSMISLFKKLPNLSHLTLETVKINCNGCQWKQILVNYLGNLKVFRLKMNLNFSPHRNIEKQVNELIDSFRSSFWIEEHQWFVRCDWNPFNITNHAILYTLPYRFDKCFNFDSIFTKSTSPNDKHYWSYDRVQTLSYENSENDLSKDSILFSARFPNLHHLKMSFPFQLDFNSCISSLNRLISLNATLRHTDSTFIQSQDLFYRSIHLYSFRLSYIKHIPMELFRMKSRSIHRLDFLTKFKSNIRYFNNEECLTLINSFLGRQCQVLLIGIENRTSIIDLINQLFNLRSLICQCKDDKSIHSKSSSSSNDELIQWLSNNFPSTYFISRDIKRTSFIRIWIG